MKLLRLITLIALAVLPAAVFSQCDGVSCAGGCCPEATWVCCPDDIFCAPYVEYCPETSSFSKSTTSTASKYLKLGDSKGDDNQDGAFLSESP
mmetsp:Transcript_28410/g.32526  ORF Transcript_28410/g.32526 Transcript_28410/m.32526 type:complete len:93 (+) Transcript_28410:285-563(+)